MSEHVHGPGDGATPQGGAPTVRRTRIEVALDRGVFMISVAAELAEMHPQTLRMYEARGLIEPSRSPKGTRLYSQADVERLRRIQQMTAELGLNLAGVERVLALENELAELEARLRETAAAAEAARAEMEAELERVRRSMSVDIVRYTGATTALVRAADARAQLGRRPGSARDR
jgi:MerR family transcriptional regulator/heat shock protein HspR